MSTSPSPRAASALRSCGRSDRAPLFFSANSLVAPAALSPKLRPRSDLRGSGAKAPLSATKRATDRVWTDWAAQHGVSETIAAALLGLGFGKASLFPKQISKVVQRYHNRGVIRAETVLLLIESDRL